MPAYWAERQNYRLWLLDLSNELSERTKLGINLCRKFNSDIPIPGLPEVGSKLQRKIGVFTAGKKGQLLANQVEADVVGSINGSRIASGLVCWLFLL